MFNRTGYRYKQTIATVKQYYLEKVVVKYYLLLFLDTPFIPIFICSLNVKVSEKISVLYRGWIL